MQKEYVGLIEEYCSLIKNHFRDRLISICLFGSVARGEAKPGSDIDILVVADDLPIDIGLRIKETNYVHENLKKSEAYISLCKSGVSGLVSDIFFTPEEIERHPPILLDMVEDGIIWYDKEDFLRKVLLSIKENLKKLEAKKVTTEKGYYWVLKPDIKPGEIVRI
ncbi:MAG: nucleotidyltransferase domain-containing protein [archaeon]|nr:nucleotidyltransferase domain-containing protein [archaeon]